MSFAANPATFSYKVTEILDMSIKAFKNSAALLMLAVMNAYDHPRASRSGIGAEFDFMFISLLAQRNSLSRMK